MYSQFSQAEIEALKHYVYCLVDPRDKKIFYVGKGQYNRVFSHAKAAILEKDESLKLNKIRDIISHNHNVEYYILRHGLTNHEAKLLESTIINLLTYPAFNKESLLTNIVAGYHQWDEGIMTTNEIIQLYRCEKLVPHPGHLLLMVNLNRTYKANKSSDSYRPNIYEATRKYWHLNKSKADRIDYVLGVYKGIVRLVIKPTTNWRLATHDDSGIPFRSNRYEIEGDIHDKEGNSLYLHKEVKDYPFPSRGAIRYIEAD